MALGTLYYGTFFSEREGEIRVNILVDAPTTGAVEVTIEDCKVTYEGDGDGLFGTVLQASSCTIGIKVDSGSALDTFLMGIIGNENEYFIEILRNDVRDWIGKVLLDVVEIEDAPIYTYNMTAICGLGTLKDFDFDYALDSGNGAFLVLGEVLRKALLPCFTDVAYATTDKYISSTANFYEDRFKTLIGTSCPLQSTRVARLSLIKDVEEDEPLTCAEVIERILGPFGVRIRMQNGNWYLLSPSAYTQSLMYVYHYGNRDYSTGPLSVVNFGHETAISSGNLIDTIAGNTFTYKPALIRVDVKYNPISKFVMQKDFNTDVFYPNFDVANLNSRPIKISGNVSYEVPRIFNGISNTVNGTVRMTFIVKALAGATQKYRLDYTNALGFFWTTNLSSVCVYDFSPVTDSRAVDEQQISLDLPVLTDTSITNLSFEIYLNNLAVSCGQAIDWGCTLFAQQLFDNGTYEDDIAYTTDNTVLTNNSVYKEYELYHADNENSLVLSALQAKNSSSGVWGNSEDWVVSYATSTVGPIGQILSKQIMSLGREAINVYQCTLYFGDSLTMLNSLTYLSKRYFINSGELDYKTSDFTGDLIEINNILTGSSGTTGRPYRSTIDRLRGQVQSLERNVGDIGVGLGRTNGVVLGIGGRVDNLEQVVQGLQPALSTLIDISEGYTPGTTVPLNINIDSNGNVTFSAG